MPSRVNYSFSKLAPISEVDPALWTTLGFASISPLEAEKGSTLDDDIFSSIFVATSWASWIVLGALSLRRNHIFPIKALV
jgi:hypothetical protein